MVKAMIWLLHCQYKMYSSRSFHLHQEWSRKEHVEMHDNSSPITHALQKQTQEHHKCETPCSEREDHDNLSKKENCKESEIDLISVQIWNIFHRRIFHVAQLWRTFRYESNVSGDARQAGNIFWHDEEK